jgi:hypothetical protein
MTRGRRAPNSSPLDPGLYYLLEDASVPEA